MPYASRRHGRAVSPARGLSDTLFVRRTVRPRSAPAFRPLARFVVVPRQLFALFLFPSGLRAKNTLRFALLRVDHLRVGLQAQGGGPATQQF